MNHKIHVVEQNPLAIASALNRVGISPKVVFQTQLDLIGNGNGLPLVGG